MRDTRRSFHQAAEQCKSAQISQMVTGASTRCTLLSSTRISKAFSHSCLTSGSFRGLHSLSCSIHLSRSDMGRPRANQLSMPDAEATD